MVGILEVVKEGGRILEGKCDSGVWIFNQLMYRGVPCLLGGVLRRITMNIMRIDDAEIFTSEVHDPYARTTGA